MTPQTMNQGLSVLEFKSNLTLQNSQSTVFRQTDSFHSSGKKFFSAFFKISKNKLALDSENTYVSVKTEPTQFTTDCRQVLRRKTKWLEEEYRQAYMETAVEQSIAWQVRLNRESRNLSQSDLATMIATKQSSISRIEDPTYGAHSLKTLLKIANAFDCALLVKFVSFSVLAMESKSLSEEHLVVKSFTEEIGRAND